MEVINRSKRLCVCCMEEHDVSTVRLLEQSTFKGKKVNYIATYEYCDNADEYWESDETITENNIALKNAYRSASGLLTSDEICAIRRKYGISQTDLAILLGWGGKTITRYETHQVQDVAHDTILRKLASDPEWFLSLLKNCKEKFTEAAFKKYYRTAVQLFEDSQDAYLRKSIAAQYAKFEGDPNICGGTILDIDKLIDVIAYFCNSSKVFSLFKVKLMKLLWYTDALSYKRRGYSMTGLAYTALPMGAVPIAHKSIIDLKGIEFEEIEFDEGTGIRFKTVPRCSYEHLIEDDLTILNDIIKLFGNYSKNQIVSRMHTERAYTETAPYDIIQYQYALELSIE